MRTSLALLASALLAAPSVLAAPEQEWWHTMSKYGDHPYKPWGPPTSDCSTSTSYWTPPPPPGTTSCSSGETTFSSTPSESPTPYEASTPYESWTTTTASTTSSPGGYVGSPSTSYPVPTSVTSYGAGIIVSAPLTSYPIATPSSTLATYAAANTTTSVAKPTYTVPVGGAAQKRFSFSAVMVGAVGVLFAML